MTFLLPDGPRWQGRGTSSSSRCDERQAGPCSWARTSRPACKAARSGPPRQKAAKGFFRCVRPGRLARDRGWMSPSRLKLLVHAENGCFAGVSKGPQARSVAAVDRSTGRRLARNDAHDRAQVSRPHRRGGAARRARARGRSPCGRACRAPGRARAAWSAAPARAGAAARGPRRAPLPRPRSPSAAAMCSGATPSSRSRRSMRSEPQASSRRRSSAKRCAKPASSTKPPSRSSPTTTCGLLRGDALRRAGARAARTRCARGG